MSFLQFLAVIRARWKLCVAVFVASIAVAIIASLVMPKKYRAEASVVVDVKPDPLTALYGGVVNPSLMATQVDILTSDRVARRVIRNLKLDQNPQVRAQWQEETEGQGSIEDWLGGVFEQQLDVKPSRESNVITVTYKSADPKFAAGLANAFVQAYLDTALELRVDPAKAYSGFFEKQAKDARSALEAAQTKLTNYQRDNGIVANDERFDVETSRLNDLAAQLVEVQGLSADATSRQSQASLGNTDKLQETLNNGVIQGLKVDLARSEARLQELSAQYGENYPGIKETKANIAEMRARIDAETRRVTGSVSISNTITHARASQIQAALDQQRARVLKLKEQRDRAGVLQRDVDNAQASFQAVAARLNQSSLESQTQQSNVSLLSPATPPIQPYFPRLILNTAAGIFMGVILAVGLALFQEIRDRRVRASRDLVEFLGLPILGVMPRPIVGKRRHTLARLVEQRLISGRPPVSDRT